MKVQAVFAANIDEIDEARRLDMRIPEIVESYGDFYMKISSIDWAHITTKGHIHVCISGMPWTIVYNKDVWEAITAYLGQGYSK